MCGKLQTRAAVHPGKVLDPNQITSVGKAFAAMLD